MFFCVVLHILTKPLFNQIILFKFWHSSCTKRNWQHIKFIKIKEFIQLQLCILGMFYFFPPKFGCIVYGIDVCILMFLHASINQGSKLGMQEFLAFHSMREFRCSVCFIESSLVVNLEKRLIKLSL